MSIPVTLRRDSALFQASVELIRALYLGFMVYHHQTDLTAALPVFFFQGLIILAAYGVYRAELFSLTFSATIALWRLISSLVTHVQLIPVVFIHTDVLLDPARAKHMYLIGLGTTVLPAFILCSLFLSCFFYLWKHPFVKKNTSTEDKYQNGA